jgi:ABC-type multidrug transport system ATPase subunit
VSLASMIVRRPRLWLLDEPHAGLDADGRDLVDRLVVDATDAGATVLFASHDLDRATEVATRIVTIVGGAVADDSADGNEPRPGAPDVA